MRLNITVKALFLFTLLSCEDDVRIKVVGKSNASSDFQINSSANLVTRESYTLTWSENPAAKSYEIMIARDQNCSDIIFKKDNITENKLALDDLADGQYYLCVYAHSKTQRFPATNNGVALTIDTTSPMVVIPQDVQASSEAFDPDLKIEDISKVSVTWTQVAGEGTVEFGDKNSLKPKVQADQDGIYKIQATITDEAGNSVEQIYQFVWDQTGPSVSFATAIMSATPVAPSALVDSTAVSYEWTYSDGPQGGILSFSDPTAKKPTISADLEGTYQLTLKAKDKAGNIGSDTTPFTWDTTPPKFESFGFSGPALDGFLNAQDRLSTASIGGSLLADAYTEVAYKIVTAGISCNSSLTYTPALAKANSASFGQDGSYKICIRLTDEVGLTTYGSSSQLIVDTAAAVFTSIDLAGAALDGAISLAEHSLSNELVTNLIANEAYISEYALVNEGTSCSGPLGYSATAPKSNDSRFMATGNYRVCVRVRDEALNAFVYGQSATFTYAAAAPTFFSLAKTGDASDAYVNDAEKSGGSALWTLNQNGAFTFAYTAPLNDSGSSLTCDESRTYTQTSINTASDLTSDGIWNMCVRLRDAAGNTTYGKGEAITRDTLLPSFVSLAGANEAADGSISIADATSTAALFALSAADYDAASYTSALSDIPSLICDASQTYSQSTIPAIDSLGAADTYALCVKITDTAGNVTFGKSQSIVKAPAAAVFVSLAYTAEAADGAINDSEKASVNPLWTLSGTGLVAAAYTTPLNDAGGAINCDVSQTYSQSTIARAVDLTSDGLWVICARLDNGDGVYTYGKSQQIYRNITGPSFTSLLGAHAASDGYLNDAEKSSSSLGWALSAGSYVTATYTTPLSDTAGALVCNASQTYGQSTIPQIDAMTSDGAWAICVRLVDAASNTIYGKSQQIIRDSVPPTFTSLLGANEASNGSINSAESASNLSLFGLIASGYDTLGYTVALDDTGASVSCTAGQTYDQAAVPLISALASDKPYALCARLADNAGNIVYGKSQQVIRDTVAPSLTSLLKTAEAADGYVTDSEKSATQALWTLSAAGQLSTAYTLALSDNGGTLACDATKTYDQGTTLPTAASITSDGAWSVCVRLTDSAGNITYGKGEQITCDIDLPVFTSLTLANAAADSYINDSEKLLTSSMWTLSASGQSATDYTVALDDTAGAQVCDGSDIYDQVSIATPASLSSDGVFVICVRLTDTAGNVRFGKSTQMTRDTVSPSLSSLNGSFGASDLYISAGEEASTNPLYALVASGYLTYDFSVALDDDPSINCDSAKTYDQNEIPSINSIGTDGKYAICVKLTDAAGNSTYGKSQQVERDIDPPAFTSLLGLNGASDGFINGSEMASTATALALTASAYATVAYTLPLNDASGAQVCNSSDTYDQTTLPQLDAFTADGAWAVCVKLTDAASNVTYGKSQQINRDTVAPVFTSLSSANGAADLFVKASEAASTAALFTLSASGQTNTAYTLALVDNPAISCDVTQTYDQATIAQIDSLGADESYAVCVRLTDAAGNITYGKSQTVVKDSAAPSFTSLVASAEGADGYIMDSEKAETSALWTLNAAGAATIEYTSALDDTSAAQVCDGSDSYNQGSSIPGASGLASDGAWTLCVRLTDAAGNITYGKGAQIIRDTDAPTFTSLVLANAASDGYINDSEKLLVNAMWALSASGQSAANYTLALDDTGAAQVCDSSDTYDQASIATPASLSSDGKFALCVRLSDAAGNITYGKSQQLERDVAVPILTSFLGANGAGDGYINDSEKSSAATALALSASGYTAVAYTLPLDDTSGAQVCNVSDTYDQAVIPQILAFTADGTWAICVRLSDAASNVVYGKSQAIIRETGVPLITSFTENAGDSTYKNTETLTIHMNMDSPVNVTAGVTLSLSNGQTASCGTGTGLSTLSCTYTIATAHTNSAALDVTALNNASNITDAGTNVLSVALPPAPNDLASIGIIIDTAAPTGVSISAPADASLTSDNTPTVNWSAADANSLSYNLAIATSSGCASPVQSYSGETGTSKTLTTLADNTYFVCLTASDSAGNASSAAETTFTVDTTEPTISSFTENSGDGTYKAGETLTIDVNMDSVVDIAAGVTLTLSNGETATCATGSDVSTFSCTYTVSSGHTNTAALNVSAINGASNITDAVANQAATTLPAAPNDLATLGLRIDTVPPGSFAATAPSDGSFTTDNTPTLGWSAATGAATYNLAVGTNSSCSSSDQTHNALTGNSQTLTVQTDGTYYICLDALDTAGNSTSSAEPYSYIVETTPPNPTALGAAFDSDTAISLNWTSGGNTTTDFRISYQAGVTAPSTCALGTTISEASISGTSHQITGLAAGTQYSFRVCAINGDASPDVSSGATITQRTANPPPLVTSMVESGGDATYKLGETVTIHVNFDVTVDVAAGVSLTLSNGYSASCSSGNDVNPMVCSYTVGAGHNADPLLVTAVVNPSNIDNQDGIAYAGGLPTAPNDLASAGIRIDTTAPTISITSSAAVDPSNWSSYAVTGTCSENGSISISGTASGSGSCSGGTFSINVDYSSSEGILISVLANITDLAGNAGSQAQASVDRFLCTPAQKLLTTFSGLGAGTAADPYLVCNVDLLQKVKDNLNAYYEVGCHINASATSGWTTGLTGTGFIPIGSEGISPTYTHSPFNGSFHGNDYVISGLYINRTKKGVGLFGATGQLAVVSNVRLTNVNVTGGEHTGAMVGIAQGSRLKNLYVGGSVQNSVGGGGGLVGKLDYSTISDSKTVVTVNGVDEVGGVVGEGWGPTVVRTEAQGTVTGSDWGVGGILGYNYQGVLMDNKSSANVSGVHAIGGLSGWAAAWSWPLLVLRNKTSGTVVGTGTTGGSYNGGLIGYHYNGYGHGNAVAFNQASGSVTGRYAGGAFGAFTFDGYGDATVTGQFKQNFATGNVSGTNYAGGFAAYTWSGGATNGQKIQASFATGAVSGSLHVAGFWGNVSSTPGANLSGVQWYNSRTYCLKIDLTASNSGCTKAASAAVFENPSYAFYDSWDFAGDLTDGSRDDWKWDTSGLPQLAARSDSTYTPTLSGSGTAEDPYLISSVSDFNSIGDKYPIMASHFKLTQDLNFTAQSITPIGSGLRPFMGTFDGDGYVIRNLSKSSGLLAGWGIFLFVVEATIKNLRFDNISLTNINDYSGLIGTSYSSDFYNIDAINIAMSGSEGGGVGGLVGQARNSHFERVHVKATLSIITGGGMTGACLGCTVKDSYTEGSITASSTAGGAGGFDGTNGYANTIINSYSSMQVQAIARAGGFHGNTAITGSNTILNSFATGQIIRSSGTLTTFHGINYSPQGDAYSGAKRTNVHWLNRAGDQATTCFNASNVGCTIEPSLSNFYLSTHPVYNGTPAWDFTNVWQTNAGALPTLRPFW